MKHNVETVSTTDVLVPVCLDQNILRKITGKEDPEYLGRFDALLDRIIPNRSGLEIVGSPSSIIEYLGVMPKKLPRPGAISFPQDMAVAERISLLIEHAENHYKKHFTSQILEAASERQKAHIGQSRLANLVFEGYILANVYSHDFLMKAQSHLSLHYAAGFPWSEFGTFDNAVLSQIKRVPGVAPETRFRWAVSHALLYRLLSLHVKGFVAPFARVLARFADEMFYDHWLVEIDSAFKPLKSVLAFRNLEDALDVEIVCTSLIGSPRNEPVTCLTDDNKSTVHTRVIVCKHLLEGFLRLVESQAEAPPLHVQPNYGKIIILDKNGFELETIDPGMLGLGHLNVVDQLGNTLQSFDQLGP